MGECKLCRKRERTGSVHGSQCAFRNGVFTRDNWNCATMNRLRQIAEELNTVTRDDMECASIGYVPLNLDVDDDYLASLPNGYIVMTWYKNRGTTGNAIVMGDDDPLRELTLQEALVAVERYG